jgi:enolase
LDVLDKDPARYRGKGTLDGVERINKLISPLLLGRDPLDQEGIDEVLNELDRTLY